MRRLGLVMTLVGAVAFAALLALGLALGSDSVSANDDEATATPTAAPQACTPIIPGTYNGSVTVDGSPAADGVTITANIDSVVWGTTTTSGGRYVVDVPQTLPKFEPDCFPGVGTVTFACDGNAATESDTWGSGLNDLNLTCAAAPATPVATPEATPVATPEASPVATATPPAEPPPTGMGGGTSGGGFIWWPLALAAAAMTSVAGLFTTRWARR